MALRTKVVNLVWRKAVQQRGKRAAVREIGIVQKKAVICLVEITEDVIDAFGIEAGCTPLEPVNFVTFG